MERSRHDLVVIGAGPGGYQSAIRAAQLGLDVGVVEKDATLGGTCLNVGCIPSKALLESSELYAEAAHGAWTTHGIRTGAVELDLAALLKRKDQVVKALTTGVAGLFKKHKIARHTGRGRITAPGRVSVAGADGQDIAELEAKHILIATGSKPASLPGVVLDGDRVGTSTEAIAYREVPKRLVVIGAGYIGLELGSVWRRLGSHVVVVEFLNRILPGMDDEMAAEAQKVFAKQGLEFHLGKRVTAARADGDGAIVEIEGSEPIACDRVLVAVGRLPFTEGLGLESVGIALDPKGRIPVDAHWQTSAPGIYAIGDVIAGPMLAHKAEEEGVAVAEWIGTGWAHVNYETIPGVCYTNPEFATVGKTEEALKAEGIPYRKGSFPFRANARARTLNQLEGRIKILAHRDTDRVLGVHIFGPRAGELIAEATLAMELGASSEDIARTCHAHPTLPEVLREAALAVDGRPLNI
ncbi:MAG: dihydrolipoyl dehydrogenase [bacterium]